MAVYTADHGDEKGLAELTQRWLGLENGATFASRLPFPPPYVEKVQATWWSTIPFAKRAYSVDFVLDRSQSVSFLFKCDGDGIKSLASLRLVSLVKEQLE